MITFTELLKRAKSERIVVHTPTEEQAIVLLSELDKRGYEWASGKNLTTRTYYEDYKENTCYNFGKSGSSNGVVVYGSLKFHQEMGYTIIEFKDIDWKGDWYILV